MKYISNLDQIGQEMGKLLLLSLEKHIFRFFPPRYEMSKVADSHITKVVQFYKQFHSLDGGLMLCNWYLMVFMIILYYLKNCI